METLTRCFGVCNMADNSELQDLTFGEIKKLKVIELKTRLSNLGLPVSGMHASEYFLIF